MPKDFSRTSRLGEQIQREVAQLIQFEMKNPSLGMVTLNSVKVSKDLGYADIYFTVMGAKGETDEEIRATATHILNEAAGYLRSELARMLSIPSGRRSASVSTRFASVTVFDSQPGRNQVPLTVSKPEFANRRLKL